MKLNNALKLIIAITVSEMAGVIGAFFTTPAIPTWYAGIVKPTLNPPAWVFGPVWTTLFALMGISAWLVWKQWDQDNPSTPFDKLRTSRLRVKIALAIFGLQLFLNTLWSIIFFGLHSPGGALVEIVFLWLAILATIIAFAKISPPSPRLWRTGNPAVHPVRAFFVSNGAWLLLIPYILWVSFAMYLNYSIYALN